MIFEVRYFARKIEKPTA